MVLFTARCIIVEYKDKLTEPHAFMKTEEFEYLSYAKCACDEILDFMSDGYKHGIAPIESIIAIKNIFNEYASYHESKVFSVYDDVAGDILDIFYAAEV